MELAKVNEVILDESVLAEAGPSDPIASNRRSAALRARASLTALAPTRRNTNPNPSAHAQTDLEPAPATDRTSRQSRRTRNSLGAPADSMVERRRRRVGGVCPVCEEDVAEDLEEHVDRCLQDAVLPHREQTPARAEPTRRESSGSPERDELVRATDFTDFRGTGFDIRDRNLPDVEDELDIDGDEDTVLYGESQFFESDIMARDEDETESGTHRSPTSEGSGAPTRRLRDLVAVRKTDVTLREVDIEGEEEDERVSVGSSAGADALPSATSPTRGEITQDKDTHIASLMAKIEHLESALQQTSQANTPLRTALPTKAKTGPNRSATMAFNPESSALYLQAPSSAAGTSGPRPVTTVTIHPVALFSILDHFLRRTESQERVIGTLLGTRTETEIEVKSSFAVIHNETDEQVALDMDYHRTMYDLHQKVNPKEVIVGWYSTGTDLNTYSALIQNFYSQETAPYQAVHVVLDTGVREGVKQGVKAYVSSPVGVHPKPENCVFLPVPCELRLHEAELSGLDLLRAASNSSKHTTSPAQDLEVLEQAIASVSDMIDRVLAYVRQVLSGEIEGDATVGRYLLDTLNASSTSLGKEKLETLFNSQLQDTLTISYLANIVRAEVEVSSRMALVT
ncbi:hypothetical protein FRC06_004630 [Ceratobasidium sp. 370]|nr:hypothetical protein FRC06_004630 [Ceratobasidium sp. 370]